MKSLAGPTQKIEFFGVQVDSHSMELRVPGQKIKQVKLEAAKMLEKLSPPTARELSHLLGKLNSLSQAIPLDPLFCRMFQRDLGTKGSDV